MVEPLTQILFTLWQASVDFVVVGGVAVNAHGHTRATLDVDIIIPFDRANVHKLVSSLRGAGFSPRTPVDPEKLAIESERKSWKEKNMVALAFWDAAPPYTVVDVFIDHPIAYDQLVAQSMPVQTEKFLYRVCGVGHLINLKEAAARPKDIEDLKFLYDIQTRTSDLK